jgi:hypothetical protein
MCAELDALGGNESDGGHRIESVCPKDEMPVRIGLVDEVSPTCPMGDYSLVRWCYSPALLSHPSLRARGVAAR